jgi:hypothetical protein
VRSAFSSTFFKERSPVATRRRKRSVQVVQRNGTFIFEDGFED